MVPAARTRRKTTSSDRETCVIGDDDSPVGLRFHSTWAGNRDDETQDVAFCSEASDYDCRDILII